MTTWSWNAHRLPPDAQETPKAMKGQAFVVLANGIADYAPTLALCDIFP
jgi:hypothetical protein